MHVLPGELDEVVLHFDLFLLKKEIKIYSSPPALKNFLFLLIGSTQSLILLLLCSICHFVFYAVAWKAKWEKKSLFVSMCAAVLAVALIE